MNRKLGIFTDIQMLGEYIIVETSTKAQEFSMKYQVKRFERDSEGDTYAVLDGPFKAFAWSLDQWDTEESLENEGYAIAETPDGKQMYVNIEED